MYGYDFFNESSNKNHQKKSRPGNFTNVHPQGFDGYGNYSSYNPGNENQSSGVISKMQHQYYNDSAMSANILQHSSFAGNDFFDDTNYNGSNSGTGNSSPVNSNDNPHNNNNSLRDLHSGNSSPAEGRGNSAVVKVNSKDRRRYILIFKLFVVIGSS